MAELTVLTPWYPSPTKPFGGAFVRAQAMAVGRLFDRVSVVHLDSWSMPPGRWVQRTTRRDHRALLSDPHRRPAPVAAPEGRVVRVPVLTEPRPQYADEADAALEAARAYLGGEPLRADVIHAHVGLPSAWVAVNCARPDAKVVMTEHATFLSKVLAEPRGYARYDETLARVDACLAVSDLLGEELKEAFPHHRDKISVVPNVVPFDGIPVRDDAVTDLRRWLYVGSFQERKGVLRLLDAFAICRLDRPDLELTMVGGGPQLPDLEDRVRQLGLSEHVRLLPAVQPDDVFALYAAHDLLVHPSLYETFGMTVIEALAVGIPVLVTRCGGPAETLRGLEDQVGHIVDVSEGAAELVAGYRHLRARVGDLDVASARPELERRYGPAAVSAQLATHYGLQEVRT